MQILHVITTCDIGGAEVQLLALVKQQIKDGHEISVLPLKGDSSLKREFEDCGAIILHHLENKNPLMQQFLLRRVLMDKKFDVVHAHLPRAQLMSALAKTSVDKLVLTRHDAMPFYPSASKLISSILWSIVRKKSSEIIVISSAIAERMIKRREIQNLSEVVVVHYGIERSISNPQVLPAELVSIKSNRELKFVCVGRFVKEKNHESLVRAFAKLKKQHANVQLLLIGYGVLEESIRATVRALNIDDSVRFMGRRRDVNLILSVCDVFVFPSYTEGFGLVLLEAMQAGLPILASRVDAIPEILGDNCGLMFDPRNVDDIFRMLMIATEEDFRRFQSQASISRIQHFSIGKSSREIEKVYSQT